MEISKFKDVNIENVILSKPLKVDGVYTSNLYLETNECKDFIIQTPGELTYEKNSLSFSLAKKGSFYTFLEEVKDRVVEILFNNCEKFFKGKKFSNDYIYRSTESIVDINDDGIAVVPNVTLDKDVIVYDYFKDVLETHTEPYHGIFIVKFDNIVFVKKEIKINISIQAIKLALNKPDLNDVSLDFLEEEGETKETESVNEEIKAEPEQQEEAEGEPYDGNDDETENDIKDQSEGENDETEFFS